MTVTGLSDRLSHSMISADGHSFRVIIGGQDVTMDYESFFHLFDDLPTHPTYDQIRRQLKSGERRLLAFKHFCEKYPDEIEYRIGYIESYLERGLYDEVDFEHCHAAIREALTLDGTGEEYEKLYLSLIEVQRRHRRRSAAGDPARDFYETLHHLESLYEFGNHVAIEREFEQLKQTVKLCGITGGEDERLYWQLFQMLIGIAFQENDPELALQRMDEYERARIGVKLTPVPNFELQEKILGYLAERSIDAARSRLQHWMANSKSPVIHDTIKQHPAFRDLFGS